ncbi:hypothetical protein T484DRAFT_1843523 [Baffinella frigidus]|nr:hypothetical protein T484DRAFT_1843523 [Cryptophyta sp. CCMP2293]
MNVQGELGEGERSHLHVGDIVSMVEGGLALSMREMRGELDGHGEASCSVCAGEVGETQRFTALLPCHHLMCGWCMAGALAVSDCCPRCSAQVTGALI